MYDVDGVVYLAMPEGYGSETGHTYLATSTAGLNFSMQDAIITETPLYGAFFKDLNPNIKPLNYLNNILPKIEGLTPASSRR